MALDLQPDVETAVRDRAAFEGVSVNDLLARTFASGTNCLSSSADPRDRVRALLAKWREKDLSSPRPAVIAGNSETPTQAMFREWDEEDANKSEQEQERDTKFWEEFQVSINEERTRAGMRTLF